MIRYLADTNVLGYFVRNTHASLRQRMHLALKKQELAISVITRAEARYGLALLQSNDKRRSSIDLLLQEIPALHWTTAAADCYGEIAAQLQQVGRPIGVMDTLIAAHAIVTGLTLVTHNTRHFERIPELKLEDWTN